MDLQFWKSYASVKSLNVLAYDQIKNQVRSGWTEKQLYELVVKTYAENGGSQVLYEGDFISGPRSWEIEGSASDRIIANGDTIIVEGEGLLARALCHETDHLDGILYIDKTIPEEELEDVE